jgi:hypothetical protein
VDVLGEVVGAARRSGLWGLCLHDRSPLDFC